MLCCVQLASVTRLGVSARLCSFGAEFCLVACSHLMMQHTKAGPQSHTPRRRPTGKPTAELRAAGNQATALGLLISGAHTKSPPAERRPSEWLHSPSLPTRASPEGQIFRLYSAALWLCWLPTSRPELSQRSTRPTGAPKAAKLCTPDEPNLHATSATCFSLPLLVPLLLPPNKSRHTTAKLPLFPIFAHKLGRSLSCQTPLLASLPLLWKAPTFYC